MAGTTGIPWCDKCWNVVAGCTRVSEGCESCWAVNTANRLSGHPNATARTAVEGTVAMHNGRLDWTGLVRTLPERLVQPLHWRQPARIFVVSQADLFHEQVPDAFIDQVWATMFLAPQHTFLVLTKRPARMCSYLTERLEGDHDRTYAIYRATIDLYGRDAANHLYGTAPNVWLGVTAENQQRADERIPLLLQTPAAVRWVSLEPLLGPVEVHGWIEGPEASAPLRYADGTPIAPPRLGWLVAGGESRGTPERRLVARCNCSGRSGWCTSGIAGSEPHRPCGGYQDAGGRPHPGTGWRPKPEALTWLRSLRDQCVAADVPFWFKGFAGPTPRAAGHLLDGRTWEQLPEEAP